MTVRRYGPGLQAFAGVPFESLEAAAGVIQNYAQQVIRDEDRIDTSNMVNAFSVERRDKEVVLTNFAPYALYHEYGTGIYQEEGQGRKTPWRFYYDKIDSYIWTQGITPIAFMRRGADEGRNDAIKAFVGQLVKQYYRIGGGPGGRGGGGAMRRKSRISGTRGLFYGAGKGLGDISAVMGGGQFGGMRTAMYGTARGLGDVSALLKGGPAIGGRIVRRIVGQQSGAMMGQMREAGGSAIVGRGIQRGVGPMTGGLSRRLFTRR